MRPLLFGILNITRDSFSDGGRFLEPEAAVRHAHALVAEGADAVDVGPASSHPDAETVSPEEEVRRLEPVLEALGAAGIPFSVDSYHPATQRYAIEAGARWLNDIQGFADPTLWPELARAEVGLIAMHAVQRRGKARRMAARGGLEAIARFLRGRVEGLVRAGVDPERIWVDPGMGFFVGDRPEASVEVLRGLRELARRVGRPVLISVSRKSFLGGLTDRPVDRLGPATLAAELFAARQGVVAIRTHRPGPLREALIVQEALCGSC